MNQKSKQERLKKWLEKIAPEKDRIESMSVRESTFESAAVPDTEPSDVERALERLAHGEALDDKEMHNLEAIIIPGERPVVDIEDDSYLSPDAPFEHFNNQSIRQNIEPAIRSIGRVELFGHPAPYGGTAFLVGDGLMMTNRHVAELFANGLGRNGLTFKTGIGAGVDLKREIKTEDSNVDPNIFDVDEILMIHPYWDMAILKVTGLVHLTPLTLAVVDPADLNMGDVAVIGYPAFDPRNETALQNEIFRSRFNVKRMQPGKINERKSIRSFGKQVNAATHDSSTLGGNSGSAVIDAATGDVVALHFAGIYLDANFAVPMMELAQDRRVVDLGIFDGSVSAPPNSPWDDFWNSADSGGEKPVNQQRASAGGSGPVPLGSSVTWAIPMQVTVNIGGQSATFASGTPTATPSTKDKTRQDGKRSPDVTEKVVEPFHDQNYDNRLGYDDEFLGIRLRQPKIIDKSLVSKFDETEFILPYNHFSLVMHKDRRLAIYTASNIDGRPNKRKPEPGKKYSRKKLARMGDNDREKWFNDPRIPADHQLHNVFYDEDRQSFDKGHLVRRDDVTWGDSYLEIEKANGDTFHVTNCSPQVLKFNRSNKKGIWGKLENEILKQARKDDDKYTVFSGPVLDDENDPGFEGEDDDFRIDVQIPTRFWKIIVVRNQHRLESYAFILEQDLSDVDFTELTFDSKWDEHRISIEDLEEIIGLVKFPKELHDSDTFEN